uniref:Elongation of very long chain fatty acids protein n=1 Tax=Culicoides sonorensis TaxID=179676 RepID=A0A336MLV6_CULSO
MTQILTNAYDWYRDLMDNRSDPRVKDWPMMSSPFPTLALCLFYAYFSKTLAPKLMANRKPFDLRNILIVYNLFQTVFSIWIFYEYLQSGWWGHYSFKCQPVDYSNDPMALRVQFVAIFTHQFQLLFRECDYPKGFMVWIGLHGVMFLFLFSDFYKQAYQKRAAAAQKKFDDYQNGKIHANGHTNGKVNGTNEGACMPVLEDEPIVKNGNGIYMNGKYTNGLNGHVNGVCENNNGIPNGNGLKSRKD